MGARTRSTAEVPSLLFDPLGLGPAMPGQPRSRPGNALGRHSPHLEHDEASRAGPLALDTEGCSVINEGLSESIHPVPRSVN